jgi:Ca-activated chloride channel family protein
MTLARIRLRARLAGAGAAIILLSAAVHFPMDAEARQDRSRLRVEVNLVNLIVSVTDAGGRPVADLPQEAFEVSEEGQEQKVEVFESETQLLLDLTLMVDTSLSAIKELEFEKEASMRFIRRVVRLGDGLSVFGFADTVEQYTAFTSNLEQLDAGVRRIVPGAGTSLYDAVYLGGRALLRRPAGRRRVIVLVTDAGETTSYSTFEDARHSALVSEAMLYTIITQPVKNESGRNTAGEHALATITDATGGAMFRAENLEQLDGIFQQIDRELRTQYRLAYYPKPSPPPRSMRNVDVRVVSGAADRGDPARYTVRHRKVYFTGGTPE